MKFAIVLMLLTITLQQVQMYIMMGKIEELQKKIQGDEE